MKRFFYVHGPRSASAHMAQHVTEGYRTFCGIRITKRWKWLRRPRRGARRVVCKKCQRR